MRVATSITAIVTSLFLLTGCDVLFSGSATELEPYVEEVLRRPGKAIEPIPEFRQTQVYLYQSSIAQAKDPFVLFFREEKVDSKDAGTQLTEQQRQELDPKVRPPEELEQYELDSLRMVGSLDFQGTLWGLILDPDRIIHKVKIGNYMGANYGKILRITERTIELRELVQDSGGNWGERTASLSMVEDEG